MSVRSQDRVERKNEIEFIDIKQFISLFIEKKWQILISIMAFLVLVSIYSFLRVPQYSSSVLLTTNANKGSGSLSNVVAKIVPSLSQDDGNSERYSAILKSYVVLEPVIKSLNLDIVARPNYFPIIGEKIFNSYMRNLSNKIEISKPFLALSSYAWGGEKVRILKFEVPSSLKNKKFQIIYLGEDNFALIGPKGDEILKGKLNNLIEKVYLNDVIKIYISEIYGRKNAIFTVEKLNMSDAIEVLSNDLSSSTAGKKTDLILLSYRGIDPEKVASILNAIADSSVQQDITQKQEQAKKTLSFLRQQEPTVRADLLKAETLLNQYRAKSGNVALEQETKITMENIARIQNRISQYLVQKGQLEQKFTSDSLQIKDVETTLIQLQFEKNKYERKLKDLPNADQIALGLIREVEIQNQIYINLVEKIQQFELLKAGTVGDIAVMNYAQIPIKNINKPFRIIALTAIIIAGVITMSFFIIKKSLFLGIEDPDIIENKFDLTTIATLHKSKIHDLQLINFKKNKIKYLKFLLEIDSYDITVESLRSLRTRLFFEMSSSKNNIIAISGPVPGVGKSFISANLAHIFTEAGKKILLIEGDIRQGDLKQYFNKNSDIVGLCNYLEGSMNLDSIIQKTRILNLDFISCGKHLHKNPEFLLTERMRILLNSVSKNYDYIIIDTPPLLAVSDSVEICALASVSIIVFRYAQHDEKEIKLTIDKFRKCGLNLNGFIMNKILESNSSFANKYVYGYKYVKKMQD